MQRKRFPVWFSSDRERLLTAWKLFGSLYGAEYEEHELDALREFIDDRRVALERPPSLADDFWPFERSQDRPRVKERSQKSQRVPKERRDNHAENCARCLALLFARLTENAITEPNFSRCNYCQRSVRAEPSASGLVVGHLFPSCHAWRLLVLPPRVVWFSRAT